MTKQELDTYLAHDHWANRRLLASVAELPAAVFSQDLRASFGSLQGTLVHMLWGELGWLSMWRDGHFVPDLALEDFPTAAELKSGWTELEQGQQAFVDGLTDQDLLLPREIDDCVYTLAELIHQTFDHATYHRGQVALLLRQIGQAPPSTDFKDFLTELRSRGR